jgi:MFS family permease
MTPLFLGSALNPVNSSVIATALVSIAAAMHVSVGRTSILISSLYLTSAIAQPTAGRLAEEFGPRRVFLTSHTPLIAVIGVTSLFGLMTGSATIIGLVFRTRTDDSGLHHASLIMIGVGLVVLLMTVLDRKLAAADHVAQAERTTDH